jgi:phosphoribosyl 1,2-cyclic phosphodiesterase
VRGVRGKIRDALFAARGQTFETEAAIDAFIDSRLPFSVRGTFGGITSGDEYVICDLGTGVREFGNHVMAEHDPAAKRCFNVFLSHLHWDHIMGFPFFRPGLHTRQSHPYSHQPRGCE